MASKLKSNNGVILKTTLGLLALGISAIIIWLCGNAFAHEARIVGVEKDTVHVQKTVDEIKDDIRDFRKEQHDSLKELGKAIEGLRP